MMRRNIILLIALILASLPRHHAFYEDDSVINLDDTSFDKTVKDGLWLVEFYAPWCGHCKKLVPVWKEVAKGLQGIVNVAAVNADAHKSLASEFQTNQFPTIKLLSVTNGKRKQFNFKGGDRSAAGIIHWTMEKAMKIAMGRVGAKPTSGGGGPDSPPPPSNEQFYGPNSAVVVLTNKNFHEEVSGPDLWLVEFYAPWCGHCKNLKSDWEQLAQNVKGRVKIGAVDCTSQKTACQEFGVRGYPTIKFFGEEKDEATEYQGGRALSELEDFVIGEWRKTQSPPEAKQLVDQHVFETDCLGSEEVAAQKLCFLAFLPHILDSKAAGRREYIQILNQLAKKYADRPFSYLWAEGGAHSTLEKALEVGGYGYPALVALNPHEAKFATLRDSFDAAHATEFAERIRMGRERVLSVSGNVPELESSDAWDGEDGQAIEEEEFSLEDLMAENKDEL